MKMTIDLDEKLISQLMRLGNYKTIDEAIDKSLDVYIEKLKKFGPEKPLKPINFNMDLYNDL